MYQEPEPKTVHVTRHSALARAIRHAIKHDMPVYVAIGDENYHLVVSCMTTQYTTDVVCRHPEERQPPLAKTARPWETIPELQVKHRPLSYDDRFLTASSPTQG